MYYGSGTDERCCINAGKTLCVHSPRGGTVLCEISHGLHLEITTSNRKSDSVNHRIFIEENPAKFHTDPT